MFLSITLNLRPKLIQTFSLGMTQSLTLPAGEHWTDYEKEKIRQGFLLKVAYSTVDGVPTAIRGPAGTRLASETPQSKVSVLDLGSFG